MRSYDHIRTALVCALVVACPSAFVASVPSSQAPEGIDGVRNFTRVDATVALAGAVSPEAIPAIKAAGFTSIVNLRSAEEAGADLDASRKAAEAAGLRYYHVPMIPNDPRPETVDRFLEIARDKGNEPMLLHCASGGRASMLLAIKRVMVDGWSVEKAMAEVPSLSNGMRPVLREFAMEYLAKHGKTSGQ